jgi:hypothetical protein
MNKDSDNKGITILHMIWTKIQIRNNNSTQAHLQTNIYFDFKTWITKSNFLGKVRKCVCVVVCVRGRGKILYREMSQKYV